MPIPAAAAGLGAFAAATGAGLGVARLMAMDEEDEAALASIATKTLDLLNTDVPVRSSTGKGAAATSTAQDQPLTSEPEEYGDFNPDDVLGEDENNESWEPATPAVAPKPQAAPPAARVHQDTGGWAYEDVGSGRVRIVSAPANSRMVGQVLDPAIITTMLDGPQKTKLLRAYASIQNVMAGLPPLVAMRGGPAKRPAAAMKQEAPVEPAAEPTEDDLGELAAEPPAEEPQAPKPTARRGPLFKTDRFLDQFVEPNYFDTP